MWMLAQIQEQLPGEAVHRIEPVAMWLIVAFELFASLMTIPYFLFLVWMLIHCYRTEPDRQFWIWILLIAQPIGPVAYFILRYLPSREFPAPAFVRQWTRGSELLRLETAAQQIGNAYQYVLWGDALREVGRLDQAKSAYEQAMKKDHENIQSIWGAAQVAANQKRYEDLRRLTRQVLDKEPQYKFGDVSLAHGRALNELGEFDAARAHFEQHIRRWRHPEALYDLAVLCMDQGDSKSARQHLLAMLQDINGSPAAIGRKFGRWKSRARQLLRKIPA